MSRLRALLIGSLVATLTLLGLPSPAEATGSSPSAANDTYHTHPDEAITPTRSVLKNDTDPEGDPLTATVMYGPYSGTLDFQANGRFTYTPNPGFEGSDFFAYVASDGTGWSNWAYVSIDVNAPPVAVDDNYTTLKNKRIIIPAPGVLSNDVDASPGRQRARLVSQPANGTASLTQLGQLRYKPKQGFVGVDTFTYLVNDGEFTSNTATVTVTVKADNAAPIATPDTYILGEDIWLEEAAPGLLANDSDPDGDPLMAEIIQYPFFGYLSLDPSGAFTYEPYPDFDSDVTFTYRVFDGIAWSEPVEVLIDMYAINDPPYAEYDYYGMTAGTTLEVSAPGVLANDYDPVEGDLLTAQHLTDPVNGTLTLNSDGSFSYTPDPGFVGWDSFGYLACDPGGCAGADVTIEVFEAS